jgi:hypothetical protein
MEFQAALDLIALGVLFDQLQMHGQVRRELTTLVV